MTRRRRALRHLEDDLRDHIERETRENLERGMAPAEARAAALRKFGNATRVTEETRAVWAWLWLDQLRQDIRYGVRSLRRNPGFAAVVVLTLALGIGMNTAVFSLVNAILVRPLPYPSADRLLWLAEFNKVFKAELVFGPDYIDWKRQANSFESMAAYAYSGETIATPEGAESHRIALVTPEFWGMSGARPALGRLFTPRDREVVILTDTLFERQFHRDPHIIGRAVTMDGRPVTIVGVLPKSFRFLFPLRLGPQQDNGREIEAYVPNPITWDPPVRSRPSSLLLAVAKLKPRISVESARSELKGIQARIAGENPNSRYDLQSIRVMPLQEKLVADTRPALLVLLAAVGFVLLIVCANIANLLLARGAARQKEIAIRTAIGAGRARVIRQLLGENLALALLGGALGLLLASLALPVIVRLAPPSLPRLGETTMDARVLLFGLVATLVTGLFFSISPAIFLRRSKPYEVLKQGGRASSASSAGLPLRRFLVAAELALSLVLLTGAGLMVKSFWRMHERPPDFVPERVLSLNVLLSRPRYQAVTQQKRFAEEILERVEHIPGVQAAGLIVQFARGMVTTPHTAPLPPLSASQMLNVPQATFYTISPGLGRVLGMRLVRGRWLTGHEAAPALMVNESLSHVLFASADPVGKQLALPLLGNPDSAATIVGVVADLKHSRLDATPGPEVYIPYQLSDYLLNMTVMVRTAQDAATTAPAVQHVVGEIDHTQAVSDVRTLEHALAESIAPRRFNLFLLVSFAASALLLALIGIYAVIAYAVGQRTHEIGVRMALGAQRTQVVRLVIREGMSLAALGIASGLATAFGLTRLMASLLYDVKPNDPSTYAVVALAVAATALAACWKPALRAAWVDPATALREE